MYVTMYTTDILQNAMKTKTTLPISEARKNIFKIAQEVQNVGNYYTLTEKGRPKIVIMSVEEFESWQETLEVLQEFPDIEKDVKETKEEYKKGIYKEYLTLDALLKEEGYTNKNAKKDDISSSDKKKSRKRTKKVS